MATILCDEFRVEWRSCGRRSLDSPVIAVSHLRTELDQRKPWNAPLALNCPFLDRRGLRPTLLAGPTRIIGGQMGFICNLVDPHRLNRRRPGTLPVIDAPVVRRQACRALNKRRPDQSLSRRVYLHKGARYVAKCVGQLQGALLRAQGLRAGRSPRGRRP